MGPISTHVNCFFVFSEGREPFRRKKETCGNEPRSRKLGFDRFGPYVAPFGQHGMGPYSDPILPDLVSKLAPHRLPMGPIWIPRKVALGSWCPYEVQLGRSVNLLVRSCKELAVSYFMCRIVHESTGLSPVLLSRFLCVLFVFFTFVCDT